MSAGSSPNRVREALVSGRFLMSIELTSPTVEASFDDAIRPILELSRAIRNDQRIDAIALTDRTRSDHDHDPIAIGHRVLDACGRAPIVHLAGKDRGPGDLEANLDRAESLDLDTFLLVTGDRLRQPPADRRVRYLDSVHALDAARQRSETCVLAAAICPFKYREEELANQYLKAGKKLRAGANLLMTQIGWDMLKFAEARRFLSDRGYHAPLVANLLFLTARNSRRIRQADLPGVILTDDLAQKVDEEARAPDGGQAAAYHRLALQVVGVRHMGYSGVQVTGLHTYARIARLLEEVDVASRTCPTPEDWWEAWRATLTFADGRRAQVAPDRGLYLGPGTSGNGVRPERGEYTRFQLMELLDHVAFREGSPGARVIGPLMRRLDARSGVGGALLPLEAAIKQPLVGCQTCGFCRLPQTVYVCPETCPKGLANGPCGGTRDNVCEFGDHECIHNRIYRLSKQTGRLADLEEVLIPPAPEGTRNSCSWVTHFQGKGPRPVRMGRDCRR